MEKQGTLCYFKIMFTSEIQFNLILFAISNIMQTWNILYSLFFALYFLSAQKVYCYECKKKYKWKICVYRFVYKEFNERLAIFCKKKKSQKKVYKSESWWKCLILILHLHVHSVFCSWWKPRGGVFSGAASVEERVFLIIPHIFVSLLEKKIWPIVISVWRRAMQCLKCNVLIKEELGIKSTIHHSVRVLGFFLWSSLTKYKCHQTWHIKFIYRFSRFYNGTSKINIRESWI